jgi:uncharacterized membrane protein
MNFKFPKFPKSEYLMFIQFILGVSLFLVVIIPFHVPHNIARFLESTLGISLIFTIAFLLFWLTDPFIALLFFLLAFLVLSRCCVSKRNSQHVQYTPTRKNDDSHMMPVKTITLEEQTISQMAPIDKDQNLFIDTTFKPMYNNLNSASLIR